MSTSVESTKVNFAVVDEDDFDERKYDLTKFTQKFFKVRKPLVREALSEILSTFLLITFGCGSVAQTVLRRHPDTLSINLSWGLAVTIGILVGGKISGAHMNPAVSLTMLILGNMGPSKFIVYIISQSIGAFLGSLAVYVVYSDALTHFDGGVRQVFGENATAGIWATYPQDYLSISGAFVDQIFGTFLLILISLAVGDKRNPKTQQELGAILMGLTVALIGMTFGQNCGYAINPVRDFIPRLFTLLFGWGSTVFKHGNYFFWVPIVGPFIGAVLAAFVYALFIRNHWPNEDRKMQVQYNKVAQ